MEGGGGGECKEMKKESMLKEHVKGSWQWVIREAWMLSDAKRRNERCIRMQSTFGDGSGYLTYDKPRIEMNDISE